MGMYCVELSNSQKWDALLMCGISQCFCPGKGAGQGPQKEGQLERSHFFSITTARLQGHHSQWVVHGDAPSRKHFNYGLLARVQEGAGMAAGRLNTQGGNTK